MTAKVDEIIEQIPTLKVDLHDILSDKCLDELAVSIITESLDYALETSVRRLESVGKINPQIKETAIHDILPAVKTLRNLISNAPTCAANTLAGAPLAPVKSPPKVRTPKTETKPASPKKAKEPKTLVENIANAVTEAKAKTISPEDAEEKKLMAGLSPEMRGKMKTLKSQNVEVYEAALRSLPQTVKVMTPQAIETGKQFTLGYDGESVKFIVVDPKVMKLTAQKPKEPDVIKLSASSVLAKQLAGKKKGDTIAEIEFKGKKYSGEIKEVKEGEMEVPPAEEEK